MASRRPTLRQQLEQARNDMHERATERAALFTALEGLVGAIAEEHVLALVALPASRGKIQKTEAALGEAFKALRETCRCGCGSHVDLNARPRMCERCMST